MGVIAYVISSIIVGLIIGAIARLILPGRQPIGILRTILLGWVGAFVGGGIGTAVGFGWVLTLIIELAIAMLLVYLVAGAATRGRLARR